MDDGRVKAFRLVELTIPAAVSNLVVLIAIIAQATLCRAEPSSPALQGQQIHRQRSPQMPRAPH